MNFTLYFKIVFQNVVAFYFAADGNGKNRNRNARRRQQRRDRERDMKKHNPDDSTPNSSPGKRYDQNVGQRSAEAQQSTGQRSEVHRPGEGQKSEVHKGQTPESHKPGDQKSGGHRPGGQKSEGHSSGEGQKSEGHGTGEGRQTQGYNTQQRQGSRGNSPYKRNQRPKGQGSRSSPRSSPEQGQDRPYSSSAQRNAHESNKENKKEEVKVSKVEVDGTVNGNVKDSTLSASETGQKAVKSDYVPKPKAVSMSINNILDSPQHNGVATQTDKVTAPSNGPLPPKKSVVSVENHMEDKPLPQRKIRQRGGDQHVREVKRAEVIVNGDFHDDDANGIR